MRRTVGMLLLAALFLSGCEISARVDIDVADDGSGTVGVVVDLDQAAVRMLELAGQDLTDAVRLDDLEGAGWEVTWERRDGDGAVLRLERGFTRPEDLESVVGELSGAHGPLHDVALDVQERFFQTDVELTGRADLSTLETGIADDPELVARLAAERVDPAALDHELTARLEDAFRLEVVISLPGREVRRVVVEPGSTVDLATASTLRDWRGIGLLGAAAALALAAVVVLVAGRRNHRQNRRRATTA